MRLLRFNPFNQVHKGLRALLYDTALQLQFTDFSVESEIDAAVERVQLVIRLFAHQAQIEDSRVFPMIQEKAPDVVADFEAQHVTDHALSRQLEKFLALFTETNSAEQNRCAGNELAQRFHSFLAFNVEHMKKEETLANECLWKYHTDAELMQKVQDISASQPPEESEPFLYWMLKGMATYEIIEWYQGIRHAAPPPVFTFFCELAGSALPRSKCEAVKHALQEGALA